MYICGYKALCRIQAYDSDGVEGLEGEGITLNEGRGGVRGDATYCGVKVEVGALMRV